MPGIVVVGAQWGDEGKGKATDELGDRVDYCVRYSGGNNAGTSMTGSSGSWGRLPLPNNCTVWPRTSARYGPCWRP